MRRRNRSYLFKCGPPFVQQEAFSGPSNKGMEVPALIIPGSSYCSDIIPGPALKRLLQDVDAGSDDVFEEQVKLLNMGYSNLPSFLKQFCVLYYEQQCSYKEISDTLNIHEGLVRQRHVVAISLFRILLASKPKNPV